MLTTDLIENIKNKSFLPADQSTFTEARILQICNDELHSMIVPMILSVREDHFTIEEEIDIIANQKSYKINPRSIGNALKDVLISDGYKVKSLTRLDPTIDILDDHPGSTQGFYPRGSNIVLHPTPKNAVNKLKITYNLRPSDLISVAASAKIISINTADKSVSVDSLPSTITSSTSVDIISAGNPNPCSAIDQDVTVVDTLLTFSSLPPDLKVGDYVALAGESPLVQLPREIIPVLEQRVIIKLQEALGDHQSMNFSQPKLQEMEKRILNTLTPRISGELPVIHQDLWD